MTDAKRSDESDNDKAEAEGYRPKYERNDASTV